VILIVLVAGLGTAIALSSHDPSRERIRGRPTPHASPSSLQPSPSPSPVQRGTLVVHGTGDVSLDPSYIPNFSSYGYAYAFSGMNGLFQRDDLTIINLECAVSRIGSPVPKEFNFECDPGALPAAKAAGVDVANLGNNHSYDYGPDALVDSRRNIAQAGLAPIGAGKDPEEATKPAVFERKGWRIAVVGIDEVVDPDPEAVAAPGHPGTACGHDVDCMVQAIRRADQLADLVIVEIHWGVELDTQPESYQVDQAHRFVAAGADIVFGGHSHRLQPMSVIDGKPIFWSLGNFVWPNFSAEGSRTGVAEVHVSPDGDLQARLLPTYIGSSGHPVLTG
jgi:poly-gamma-glutamate synthesis protein (capsule biosynthesis protein)